MSNYKAILVVGRTKQEAEEYARVQLLPQPVMAVGVNRLTRTEGMIATQVIVMDTVGELDDTQVAMLHRVSLKSLSGGQSIDSIAYRRTVNAMWGEMADLKEELAALKGRGGYTPEQRARLAKVAVDANNVSGKHTRELPRDLIEFKEPSDES